MKTTTTLGAISLLLSLGLLATFGAAPEDDAARAHIDILNGDGALMQPFLGPATGYPFEPPHVLWSSIAEEPKSNATDSAWVSLVCSGNHVNHVCPSPSARRLAASDDLNSTGPSADAAAAEIAGKMTSVFGSYDGSEKLETFAADVVDSGRLDIYGMILSPLLGKLEPSFGDLWSQVSHLMGQFAGQVMLYVEQIENKIEYEMVAKTLTDYEGRIDIFYSQVSVSSTHAGRICEYPHAPAMVFEQLVAHSSTYRSVIRKVCLAHANCVNVVGYNYALVLVKGFRNAMICTSLVATQDERKRISTQRVNSISAVVAAFTNDKNDIRRKLTDPNNADSKGSPNINSTISNITDSSGDSGRAAAAQAAQARFDWLLFKTVRWTHDDENFADRECGAKMVFEDMDEDVNQGMRVDKAARTLVMWEPKNETLRAITAVDVFKTRNVDVQTLRTEYEQTPAGERFGFAVLPSIEMRLSKDPILGEMPRCVSAYVYMVRGKKYDPPVANASAEDVKKEFQDLADSAYGSSSVASPGGSLGTITPNAAVNYFNGLINDQHAATNLSGAFATSDLAKALGARDPAILTGPILGMGVLDKSTNSQLALMDGIEDYVVKTNAIEVGMIKGFTAKIDAYFPKEMDGLIDLEQSMATWHGEAMGKYDEVEGNVNKLDATVTQGFADCSSTISQVQQSISNDLSGLKNQVVVSAEETRRVVKGVLDRSTQRTLGALDQLSGSIAAVHQQTMSQINVVHDVIVQRNEQLRGAITEEFYQRQLQTREMVASATTLVIASARTTTDLLLNQVDAVEVALMQQLRAIAGNVDVLKGQIVLLEAQFASAQKQVDKMLAFLASIQYTSNEILSTVVGYPEALRKALFTSNMDKLLLHYKLLNYAFTKYVENGLAPVYRYDLVLACTSYANMDDLFRSFTNLITGTASPERLEQHVAQFEYSTKDYEQFGNQLVVAAYNTQRLSLVCARLQQNLDTDTFVRLATSWDVIVDRAVGMHLLNVEENIPRFFLTKHYTEPVLTKYLNDERAPWSPNATSRPFALPAIEQLRYHLQAQIGTFAALTVVNVPSASQLQLWSMDPVGKMAGANRYGANRVRDDLVVLWSNTRKEIPTLLRDRLQTIDLPATLSAEALDATFRTTAWQRYWDAGLVRAVVRTDKIDDACPWAVSSSHYPFCWERTDSCNCVQLEGLPSVPTAADMDARALVPTDVALFTTFQSLTTVRSDFLTTARRQSRVDAGDALLAAHQMRGVPINRVRFALCMSSAPLHTVRTTTGDVHQPPPQYTRCLADDTQVYNVQYDAMFNGSDANANTNTTANAAFLRTDNVVSDAMFRTLTIGDTVPEVTFFDAQNGRGNYIVCANCVMDELRTVYMFTVLSFKLGRPVREKSAVCERHPRLSNVEYCPEAGNPSTSVGRFWTPPILLATELTRLVTSVGASFPPGFTDRVAMAERVNDALQTLLGGATDDFAFFKVYVAATGAFGNASDGDTSNFWTTLPSHHDRQERGWSVVPSFYTTTTTTTDANDDDRPVVSAYSYDALVMWSTLAMDARRVAHHVVGSKPAGATLQSHLETTLAAYKTERILRGYFSERMPADATECPVAGDVDHFAYCTPAPVDAQCMCVQLEDLPDEYRDRLDGTSAPNGRIVTYVAAADGSAAVTPSTTAAGYVVGRSKGTAFVRDGLAVWVDGRPWRNTSDASLCLQTDYSHPERGTTCVLPKTGSGPTEQRGLRVQTPTNGNGPLPSVAVGERVAEVFVSSPTWNARCRGCTDAVLSEMVQFQDAAEQDVRVLFAGLVAGRECATALADGGGELTVCVVG